MNGITVIGLVEEGVFLEDLKILIPHRVAVQIPAHQAQSPELRKALSQQRLFRLQGSLPAGATFRGSGAVPRAAAPVPRPPPPPPPPPVRTSEVELLRKENAHLRQQLRLAEERLVAKSDSRVDRVLDDVAAQLAAIRGRLDQPVAALTGLVPAKPSRVEDDAPLFIPELDRSGAVAHIEVQSKVSESDLGGTRDALRSLRRKQPSSKE